MALIKCPECGKEVSNKAKSCIHCGYPLDECKDEKLTKGDDISEDSPYACKINGVIRNVKWILDVLDGYSEEELNVIKTAAMYKMSPDQEVRFAYKPKSEKEKELNMVRFELVSDMRKRLDLVDEKVHELIYEILENNKTIPKEFNGKSHSEWSEEQKKIVQSWVHCKYLVVV